MKNPSNLEFKKKFDSIAENYDNISNPYAVKRRAESLKLSTSGLILEVGSGTGIMTQSISNSVICTDISFEMCKQTRIRCPSVVCCDAEMLPFKENVFDGIISAEMIYYLRNPENFISYSHKILKKGGKLVISMANQDMLIIDKFRSWLRHLGMHRTYFDDGVREFMKLQRLEFLLRKNNFKISSVEKRVIFPFTSFDRINRVLENTHLNAFGIFIVIKATAE
jgi:ubiquinone/menaquinone biosynthesis C-methylase UbiE